MQIVEFEPHHAEAFRTLNEAWMTRLLSIEADDREMLDDPEGQIIARGGRIFVALSNGAPAGCVALIPMTDGGCEVAKLTVAEELRGSGLGRRLLERCIEAGRAAGASRLFLETNSSLAPAIALYRSLGFSEVPSCGSDCGRCDVKMELPL